MLMLFCSTHKEDLQPHEKPKTNFQKQFERKFAFSQNIQNPYRRAAGERRFKFIALHVKFFVKLNEKIIQVTLKRAFSF